MDAIRPDIHSSDADIPQENREKPAVTDSAAASAGAPGVTADRSSGVARPSSESLVYEVDSSAHRVVVRYADGTSFDSRAGSLESSGGAIAFAFGGFGHGPGQFDTPLHAVTVSPEFFGEPHGPNGSLSILTPWVAVADYGNHRIQFFECDGAYIGEIELDAHQPPCHLAWRAPLLEVSTVEGRSIRLHVAAALLATTKRDARHERVAHRDARRTWRVC